MAELKNLTVRFGADTSQFDGGLRQVKKGLSSINSESGKVTSGLSGVTAGFGGMLKAGLNIAVIKQGLDIVKQGVDALWGTFKAYSLFEGASMRIDDLFGSAADSVKKFAENAQSSFGMAKTDATNFAAIYGNLFKNITKNSEENARVTIAMLKASAVVASKTGRTMEDTMNRIRSGLLGNTEAIEDLGINVNVLMLEATDAFKSIANGRSWEQLNFYEQQQIRTLAILEQAHKNFGDEVQKGSTYSINSLTSAMKDFKTTLGQFSGAVLQPIIKGLTELIRFATEALNALSELLNLSSPDAQKKTDDETEAQKKLREEIEKTEAAKRSLAGFDAINQLSKNAAASTSGENKEQKTIFDDVNPSDDSLTNWVKEKIEELRGAIIQGVDPNLAFDFTVASSDLSKSFENLKQTVIQMANGVFGIIPFESMLNFHLRVSSGTMKNLTGIMDILRGALEKDFDTMWTGFGKFVEGMITTNQPILAGVLGFFDKRKTTEEWGKEIDSLTMPFSASLEKMYEGVSAKTTGAVQPFLKSMSEIDTIIKNIDWADKVVSDNDVSTIKKRLSEVKSGIEDALNLQEKKTLDVLGGVNADGKYLTEDMRQQIIADTGKYYDKKRSEVSTTEKKINDILEKAQKENRTTTAAENQEITALRREMQTNGVKAYSDTEREANIILERLKTNSGVLSAAQAAEIVKNSIESKNKTIDAANEQFLKVQEIYADDLNSTDETKKENARRIIEAARLQRDESISAAEKAHENVVKEAKAQAGEHVKEVDWETGEVRSKFEAMWEDLQTGAEKLIDKILHPFREIKNGALKIFSGFGNIFIDALNAPIKALNSLKIDVPSWVSAVGLGDIAGKTFSFNVQELQRIVVPALGNGGVVKRPTIAQVGDDGAEAVMPLERNTGWIDQLAVRLSAVGGAGGDINLTVYSVLDDGTMVGKTTKRISRSNRAGGAPVLGV